jgi:hypothetical protein
VLAKNRPVFAELSGHDGFFGRLLAEGVHYQRMRVDMEDPEPGSVSQLPHPKRCGADHNAW